MSKQVAKKGNRSQEAVAVSSATRVQGARKARDHGKNRNADGSLHSTPSAHKPTDGRG